jgi:hypothetical protein
MVAVGSQAGKQKMEKGRTTRKKRKRTTLHPYNSVKFDSRHGIHHTVVQIGAIYSLSLSQITYTPQT